jgi:hypothetical protein
MKKHTIKEAAEFLGYVKKGRLYYDYLYVQGYMGFEPYGVEEVYLTDGIYADKEGIPGKKVLTNYLECLKELQKEAK